MHVVIVVMIALTSLITFEAIADIKGSNCEMCHIKAASDDDVNSDIKEQLKFSINDKNAKKTVEYDGMYYKNVRKNTEYDGTKDKNVRKNREYDVHSNSKSAIKDIWTESPVTRVKTSMDDEDTDIVDREDHFTQHLSDLLVNTDSEITSLQASEVEDGSQQFKDDASTFLVHDKEFDEDWYSYPMNILKENEMYNKY